MRFQHFFSILNFKNLDTLVNQHYPPYCVVFLINPIKFVVGNIKNYEALDECIHMCVHTTLLTIYIQSNTSCTYKTNIKIKNYLSIITKYI